MQLAELTRSLEATEAQLKQALSQGKQLASERDGLERVSAKVGARTHGSLPCSGGPISELAGVQRCRRCQPSPCLASCRGGA
jgi:hypothetical protein